MHNQTPQKKPLHKRQALSVGARQSFLMQSNTDLHEERNDKTQQSPIKKLKTYFFKQFDVEVFDFYIEALGGDTEFTSEENTYPIAQRLMTDIKGTSHRSFLILGDSGLGKTTLSKWLTKCLWDEYKEGERIPLYIYLPQIPKERLTKELTEKGLLETYLKKTPLTKDERNCVMSQPLILNLDGRDEITLPEKQDAADKIAPSENLYTLNEWDAMDFDIKMINYCRPEALRDKNIAVHFAVTSCVLSGNQYKDYYLQRFTDSQIKAYLDKFLLHPPVGIADDIKGTAWKKVDTYLTWLEKIPSLKELTRNPFLLTVVVKVLPAIAETHKGENEALQQHYTRNNVFDAFTKKWFKEQAERIYGQKKLLGLTPEEREGYLKAYAKNLAGSLLNKDGTLEVVVTEEQTLQPELAEPIYVASPKSGENEENTTSHLEKSSRDNKDKELLKHYEKKGKALFDNQENLKTLRSGCLLKTQTNCFQFLHKSLVEYLAATKLFEGLKGEFEAYLRNIHPEKQTVFNFERLPEPKIIQSLAERAKEDEEFCGLLCDIILASKEIPGLANTAAVAITVLNVADMNFSNQDLSDIQIPCADISGGFFYATNLQGANLENVRAHQAYFTEAQFQGAYMPSIDFGELPYIKAPNSSKVESLAFYQEGEKDYLLLGCDNGRIYQINQKTRKQATYYDLPKKLFWGSNLEIAAHQETALLVSAGCESKKIHLWSLKKRKWLRGLKGHTDEVTCVSFSPDGKRIASGSKDETVRLWDGETGSALRTLAGHTDEVTCVAYSPDGKTLASGSEDTTVRLWDGETGSALRTLAGHTDEVTCVAYSPDGKTLASGSEDITVRLWDGETGSALHTLSGHTVTAQAI